MARDLVRCEDNHGHPLALEVLDLLDACPERYGLFPTCVVRDQNLPLVSELVAELDAIRETQQRRQEQAADFPKGLTRG